MSVFEYPGAAPTPSPDQPTPTPELGETLRVLSKDTATLRFMWNSRVYMVSPGGEALMPFDAVKLYFGDPRATQATRTMRDSIGIVSFLPDRATEVRRLRLLYNAPFGEYMSAQDVGGIFQTQVATTFQPGAGPAFDGVRIPLVEVYNIHHQRIFTVLDDPEGVATTPAIVSQADVRRYDDALSVIHQQRQIMEVMAERLGIDPNGTALLNHPDVTGEASHDNEEDGPPNTPPSPPLHDEGPAGGTPVMEMNPSSGEIKAKRPKHQPPPDASSLSDLPEEQ